MERGATGTDLSEAFEDGRPVTGLSEELDWKPTLVEVVVSVVKVAKAVLCCEVDGKGGDPSLVAEDWGGGSEFAEDWGGGSKVGISCPESFENSDLPLTRLLRLPVPSLPWSSFSLTHCPLIRSDIV